MHQPPSLTADAAHFDRAERRIDSPARSPWSLLRWLPFWLGAFGSIAASALAPAGRRPFEINWSLMPDELLFSVTKGPHIGAAAIVALAAMVATGRHRWGLALAMSVLVGWGWEMAQTTVIGHNARLADLLPDTIGALLGCAWAATMMWLLESPPAPASRRPAPASPTGPLRG